MAELKISVKTSAGDLDIARVASLARINISLEEAYRLQRELAGILGSFERLNQVDISGIEPTAHAFPLFNVWQEDIPRAGLPVESALRNAPAQRDDMIVVPKVVE